MYVRKELEGTALGFVASVPRRWSALVRHPVKEVAWAKKTGPSFQSGDILLPLTMLPRGFTLFNLAEYIWDGSILTSE
jgi:hypothetical protein